MKKPIIFILLILTGVSCNLFNKDDDNDPPVEPPVTTADVAVVAIDAPDSVTAGATALITATIENLTNVAVNESFSVTLENETTEMQLDTVMVEGMAGNEVSELNFEWDTTDLPTGDYILRVFQNLSDDNAANNELRDTVHVAGAAALTNDISITEVSAPDSALVGDVVSIDVVLANLGENDVTETITVTLSDSESDEVYLTQTASGIMVEAEANITFEWDTQALAAGDYTLSIAHDYADDNEFNNSQNLSINLAEEAEPETSDLAITEINAADTAEIGTEVSVEVIVSNLGAAAVSDDIVVTLSYDDVEIGTQTITGLDAETDEAVTFTWDTAELEAGEYTLTAAHDYTDDDESNNTASATITLTDASASAVVDLSITGITGPSNVIRGDTAFIEVTVENMGDADVTDNIPLILHHHGVEEGSAVITGGLAAGSSTTVIIEWLTAEQTTGAPPHPLDIFIDLEDADAENNTGQISIQVDLPDDET